MKDILVYFEMAEDNYTRTHSVSYLYGTSKAEIQEDLERCFGEIEIIGYENI